jgi:hypothetical protein
LGCRAEFGGAERANEIGEIGFVDRRGGLGQAEPAALALGLFLPGDELVIDREREHIDVDHQRGAVAALLAIAIGAERHRADQAADAGLFLRLDRGGGVLRHAGLGIALGDHPAPALARGDQQHAHRRIDRAAFRTVGQGGDLANIAGLRSAGMAAAGLLQFHVQRKPWAGAPGRAVFVALQQRLWRVRGEEGGAYASIGAIRAAGAGQRALVSASGPADMDAAVKAAMAQTGAKGVAIALIDKGQVVSVSTWGVRNAKGDPLEADTIMYGASLTKAVFGYLVTQLASEGKLGLDRPIAAMLAKPIPTMAISMPMGIGAISPAIRAGRR